MKYLKKIRVLLALISITIVTMLFVDFTGTMTQHLSWMSKIQFIPAVLSANLLAILLILAVTLVFGRLYCSIICPLGIMQDVVNYFSAHIGSKKRRLKRFKYNKERKKTRFAILAVFALLFAFGAFQILSASIASIIEPYSAYGRIASQIFAPIVDAVNNMLASWSESRVDNYIFERVAIFISLPVLIVAILTFITVSVFAWIGGRDYCNTICPVGTILGYLSRYSFLKPVINEDKCISCGKCIKSCKAKCIDTKKHSIDYTRCVTCFDCIGACSEGAIRYTVSNKNTCVGESKKVEDNTMQKNKSELEDKGRRKFIAGATTIACAIALNAVAKTDGGLTPLKPKKTPVRKTRIMPPGARTIHHLSAHCTACQLCIQTCPQHIIKPRTSLEGFMQPYIDYTDGYCLLNCTRCSDVCPNGAIGKLDEGMKSSLKIGTAVVDIDYCISAAYGEQCGKCKKVCPAGAVDMVPLEANEPTSNKMPIVNAEACIGCGKCEYYCPAGSVESMKQSGSAIHIEGVEQQREN